MTLDQCSGCGRTITRGRGTPAPPGAVTHKGRGMCATCYKAQYRAGTYAPDWLGEEIAHLKEFGWRKDRIAERLGVTVRCVEKHLAKGSA